MTAPRHLIAANLAVDLRISPIVTVIVPAFNAERTLDETLWSVRSQTYDVLEILLIDDGSHDATAHLARIHAAADPRVRVISQANAGVAAARNAGIDLARGEFVAFLDADDVWRADKIARQLAAFQAGGPQVGLVYSWYALIDDRSHVIHALPRPPVEEDLLTALARRNIVGNGSAALVRRDLAAAIRFDPRLREAAAQGCEDWKFYFEAAERASFAVVPDFLVGYRQSRGNMSSDMMQMLRSRDYCMTQIAQRHPELTPVLRGSRAMLMRFMLYRAVRHGQWDSFLRVFAALCSQAPWHAATTLARLVVRFARSKMRKGARRAPPTSIPYTLLCADDGRLPS